MASKHPAGHMVTASTKKGSGKKELRDVRISKAENNGFIAEHSFESDGMQYHEPEKYALADKDALHEHISKTYGAPSAKKGGKANAEDDED